ncbi:hypothetical protein AA14337_1489 [Acetobacter malorum DSM 14337]|uniref:Uncharacterized protein n=1 Tax=Acetobacter malorum DSM 14337 TaxID=1307910 RepID=A0ABQ0PSG6_9PROT|nr:hypothetical protein [Acetobacter malorum]KXV11993.1 hypothetical protein AD930_00130 [Acetobacter malorum]GBQ79607.1 hypothetical protein AA14337_1489 [Acetobacter malorum DSM 14337]
MTTHKEKLDIIIQEIDDLINEKIKSSSQSNEHRREYIKFMDYKTKKQYEKLVFNKEKCDELEKEVKKVSKNLTEKFKELHRQKIINNIVKE